MIVQQILTFIRKQNEKQHRSFDILFDFSLSLSLLLSCLFVCVFVRLCVAYYYFRLNTRLENNRSLLHIL